MSGRAYLGLLAGSVAVAALLSALVRAPRTAPAPTATAARGRVVELGLTIGADAVDPPALAAPLGSRVGLTIANATSQRVAVALAGYEDRVSVAALDAGARRRIEFVADRPGEDFAWLVDRAPRGRFVVRGSHLVEGHR